ncbi:hypothetical protein BU16DRAFT_472045 [Lophium mytilinum]|uniref:DUF6697 domain-containing protein n=1 Tax=Lophium mytilinum TaxID=390894 RepID=A0A6A6QCR1_9PEZI|nr:hypothetical protein BU16DRAFT_472045 [Lophium mytilinum]
MFVRNLAPLPESKISIIPPTTKTMTFTLDFIRGFLGGIEWSPGLFYVPPSHGRSVLPTRTFYLLDGTHQPYLPVGPGAHGALLTAFFNENPEEYDGDEAGAAYNDVPVFICNSQYTRQIGYPFQQELNGATPPGREGKHLQTRYTYYGTYSQTRWSDKLDYDRLQEDVPQSTKMHIAETLAEVGRPEWVTEALMKHLFPKPEYEVTANLGTRTNITEDSEDEDAVAGQIQHDVASYLRKLESWEKDSRMKIKLLKKENILEAFEKPDVDDPPGLRLFWEYLECVGWDRGFYNTLVEQMLKSASR